ncbi:MAG: PLP-dependent transferase, partial [Rhodospirillales bacterium]|nr:PLP-dependent transferase [Rhodospirillales bacterium]
MAKVKRPQTRIVHAGSHPEKHRGVMNPPVYRASTVVFPTVAAMKEAVANRNDTVFYGRHGTPSSFALEEAMADLEGGFRSIALPSGLAAISVALLSFLKSGDHLLMVDNAYDPSRKLCQSFLADYGIETTFYDPMIGAGISNLLRANTKAVFLEAPGSLTFEVQDVPAIAAAAHKIGAKVILDNTWSGSHFFKPFEHGVDVSVQ